MLPNASPHSGGGRIGLLQALRSTGWRRTGAFNVLGAFASGFVLLCCLIASLVQPGSSLQNDTILFRGSCETSRYLNITLHLVLNIVSSAVLASSNYFMQILNAPSREEIDSAHRKLSSLEIGVPSLKNLPFLSGFKRRFWALLLLTSLPIHLFLNAAIYKTTYEGSAWNLTIATEQFLEGAPFFLPGASLAPAGRPSPIYNASINDATLYVNGSFVSYGDAVTYETAYWYTSYGKFTEISDYWNESSPIHQSFSEMSSSLREGRRDHWARLSSKECRQEYCSCNSRQKYGDVVVIVDAGQGRGGWTRAEVWADPQNDLSDLTKTNLNEQIPRDEVNSLWYYTQCTHHKGVSNALGDVYCEEPDAGNPVCSGALGYYWDRLEQGGNSRGYETLKWDKNVVLYPFEDWDIMFKKAIGPTAEIEEELGYDSSFNTLPVAYCLAHRGPAEKCKVNVANNLILVAMICIFCKVGICALVVALLPAESLVTPGDAINSFLRQPDSTTIGASAGGVDDFHRLEFALPHPLAKTSDEDVFVSPVPRARKWHPKRRTYVSVLPRSAWWRAFTPIATSLAMLTFLVEEAIVDRKGKFAGPLLVQAIFGRSFLGGLILANIGQLILSWCYFAYNSFITRIHVEKELSSYSTSFKSLRVSFPEGEQSVTWRLQLPYKFGIPLLLIGIILHWLASNSIFLLIIEGDFWLSEVGENNIEVSNNQGLEPGSVIAVSYSPTGALLTLLVGATLVIVLILVSLYWIPGDMVAGGCNSLVLSAACHGFCPVPSTEEAPDADGDAADSDEAPGAAGAADADETEDALLGNGQGSRRRSASTSSSRNSDQEPSPEQETQPAGVDDEGRKRALIKLAQSKLRWGVVPLTPELCDAARATGQEALHLSFATEETFISPPVAGDLYM